MDTYVIVERGPHQILTSVVGPFRSRERAVAHACRMRTLAPTWGYAVERVASVTDHEERRAARRTA